MTAAEILAQAQARGVGVELNPAGDGLRIWSDGDLPADLVELLKASKPQILAAIRAERARINRWIAAKIITWPRDNCLHCRRPIAPDSKFVLVAAGNDLAHFHQDCHGKWLAEQEVLARKALGLPAIEPLTTKEIATQ